MKLSLGVLDVAYSDANASGATTTGEVAEILEDKYHVMEVFYELYKQKIANSLAESVAGAIENLVAGRPRNQTPAMDAEQEIERLFRTYLDADEWSGIVPMTQQITAAQMGVNHRKKRPYSSENAARPSFVDTGLYQASFRAMFEGTE